MKSRRTTLTLDPDVAAKLRSEARRNGESFKQVVNSALRRGLITRPTAPGKAFRLRTRDLGLKPGYSLDCTSKLLDQLDQAEGRLRR